MKSAIDILGIDVGRSGVKIAYFENGKIVRTRIPKFAESVDWKSNDAVVDVIQKWCDEQNYELDPWAKIVLGATGAAEFERIFTYDGLTVQLLGDISVAALACGIGTQGLLLLCGTGAALVVFNGKSKIIAKAYGPVVGDLWGGLALGRLAIQHLLDSWALGYSLSDYEMALANALNITNRKEYVDWLQTSENHFGELGRLGKVTTDFAENGHHKAQEIARNMIQKMAESIAETTQGMEFPKPIPLGIQGSIIEKSPWIQQALLSTLGEMGMDVTLKQAADPLDVTALKQAKQL